MDNATELLTTRELAKRLRVSPETIRGWGRRGCIPTLRLSRKAIRYEMSAVLTALARASGKEVSRG